MDALELMKAGRQHQKEHCASLKMRRPSSLCQNHCAVRRAQSPWLIGFDWRLCAGRHGLGDEAGLTRRLDTQGRSVARPRTLTPCTACFDSQQPVGPASAGGPRTVARKR